MGAHAIQLATSAMSDDCRVSKAEPALGEGRRETGAFEIAQSIR
jgi:hypothetical protein